MDIYEVIDEIKVLLGYPTVNIEIEDDSIEALVGIAFKKVQPYLCDTQLTTIKNQPVTLLPSVLDVVSVYETDLADSQESISSITNPFTYVNYYRYGNSSMILSYQSNLYVSEYETTQSKTFRFIDHTLYLSGYQGDYITAEVYVEPSLETIVDERARTWIFDYSVALCKESLGRIRSKYKSTSTPLELDGETLVQEAQQEKERLHQELSELGYGEFRVLR